MSSQQHPQAATSSLLHGPFRHMLKTSSFWGCLCPSGSGQVGDALIKAQPQLITLGCPSGAGAGAGLAVTPSHLPAVQECTGTELRLSPPPIHLHFHGQLKEDGSRDGTHRLLLQAPRGSSLPCREHGEVKSPCERSHINTRSEALTSAGGSVI